MPTDSPTDPYEQISRIRFVECNSSGCRYLWALRGQVCPSSKPQTCRQPAVIASGGSLPYSQAPAARFACFLCGTMKPLRLPMRISRRFPFGRSAIPWRFPVFAHCRRRIAADNAWMLFNRFTQPGARFQGRFRISHVPREPQCALALLSDPGRTSAPWPNAALEVLPPLL